MLGRLAAFLGTFLLLGQMTMAGGAPGPVPAPERPGCCSHHGGVCGCEGNRAKCCDGQLSPTCGCD
jgi:hypothetical protein